jgi:lysophospholipase L1-like esterase
VRVLGPAGARVTLAEDGRALRTVTLGPGGALDVTRLGPWRCDRRTRTIVASTAGAAPATVTIATPSCAGRFALRVRPRSARAGQPIRVRVTDRWATGGVRPQVCLRMRGRDVDCAGVALRGAGRTVRLHPVRPGRASVTLAAPGVARSSVALRVRRRAGRLRVLAAGDSMIQVLDAALARRLPHASVRSDAHVSTGITKPSMLDWPARARRTARERRPDATVVFLGANDGFGLPAPGGAGQVACCSAAWVDAYATRAQAMMRAYARGGAGRVYWLTLPAPRSAAFARVFDGVNAALRRAARAYPAHVRLVDTGRVFTPGGRFRQTLRRDGRTVEVRQADGVHLSPAGDAIAAGLVVAAMRRDGLV